MERWSRFRRQHVRGRALEAGIDRRLLDLRRGETDSELCFLLLLSRLLARGPLDQPRRSAAMATAILETVDAIHELADGGAAEPSSLTFILSDGASLVAYRDGRSLHYSLDAPRTHAAGEAVSELMVASEVLSAEQSWTEVPEGGLIGIDDASTLYKTFDNSSPRAP